MTERTDRPRVTTQPRRSLRGLQFWPLVAMLAALTAAGVAHALPNRISVRVVDSRGAPIEGAHVRAEGDWSTARTDEDGELSLWVDRSKWTWSTEAQIRTADGRTFSRSWPWHLARGSEPTEFQIPAGDSVTVRVHAADDGWGTIVRGVCRLERTDGSTTWAEDTESTDGDGALLEFTPHDEGTGVRSAVAWVWQEGGGLARVRADQTASDRRTVVDLGTVRLPAWPTVVATLEGRGPVARWQLHSWSDAPWEAFGGVPPDSTWKGPWERVGTDRGRAHAVFTQPRARHFSVALPRQTDRLLVAATWTDRPPAFSERLPLASGDTTQVRVKITSPTKTVVRLVDARGEPLGGRRVEVYRAVPDSDAWIRLGPHGAKTERSGTLPAPFVEPGELHELRVLDENGAVRAAVRARAFDEALVVPENE